MEDDAAVRLSSDGARLYFSDDTSNSFQIWCYPDHQAHRVTGETNNMKRSVSQQLLKHWLRCRPMCALTFGEPRRRLVPEPVGQANPFPLHPPEGSPIVVLKVFTDWRWQANALLSR
jgi:hypothetical protein